MSTSLLVTIVLAVLILAVTIGLWASSKRAKPLVGGLGLILIPVGLHLLGITDLAVNGIMSLVDWGQRTVWDDVMTTGAALAGAGVLLAIVAAFLPGGRKPQPQAPAQRPLGNGARPEVPFGRKPAVEQPPSPARKPAPAPKGAQDGLSDEDREIAELLKKRGIM